MPTQLRQQKYPFGSLRKDPHWSTKGLVFYAQFRPAGKLIDESGHGNHGTINGPTWQGGGLYFDADDDFVDIGKPPITPDFCIVIAEKSTGPAAYNGNDGYFMADSTDPMNFFFRRRAGVSDEILVGIGGDTAALAQSSPTGVKQTYALNYHANTDLDLAIDGVMVQEGVATTSNFTGLTSNLYLGNRQDLARDFDGIISDVKIYNRVLSQYEIQALYINSNLPFQRQPLWLGKAPAAPVGFKSYWALNNNRLVGAV